MLAVDDDLPFLRQIGEALSEDFQWTFATGVRSAIATLEKHEIDALILDYVIEDGTGHQVLDLLEQQGKRIPVIVVSGLVELEMAKGFLARGTSGFLEKPVTAKELKEALVRVLPPQAGTEMNLKNQGQGLWIDKLRRQVHLEGQVLNLTPIEFKLLQYLVEKPRTQITREELQTHVWGANRVAKHALDTHLLNLRKKVPVLGRSLKSLYGVGFYYDP